jgi:hypothetical protein
VGDVSEHNPEEKGEGNASEEGRVGLLVVCHTIRLYNFLGRSGEIIDGVVGRVGVGKGRHKLPRRQVKFLLDLY